MAFYYRWWGAVNWFMKTSSNRNIFCVTGPLWRESTAHRWLPPPPHPTPPPTTRTFDELFDLHLNKGLSEQSRRRWFETPSCSLWCHCYVSNTNHTTEWIRVVCIYQNEMDIKKVIMAYAPEPLLSINVKSLRILLVSRKYCWHGAWRFTTPIVIWHRKFRGKN